MVREFGVTLPLSPLHVGERVDRAHWPLHVTLVPNVRTDADVDVVIAAVRAACAGLAPIRAVVLGEAWFGPDGDVLVNLLEPTTTMAAHLALHDALERGAGAIPVVPAYHRDGHRPHVTVTSHGRAEPGTVLELGTAVLIEVAPGGDVGLAIPLAVVDLGPRRVPQVVKDAAVVDLLRRCDEAGVEAWLVGGWGVDALLGERTRDHHDVDLLVEADSVAALHRLLDREGRTVRYIWSENRWLPDGSPSAFVADGPDGEIDVHVVRYRGGRMEPISRGDTVLPLGALDGVGTVAGTAVRCATAEAQLAMHEGYPLPDHQRGDVERLRAIR